MKKALLLAAAVLGASVASSAKAEPNQLFNILTPAAGNITFSGEGTATFNQSLGTNNNFNVGSSSNFGVNASASSTQDYTASGSAVLDLAGTSRIQQTIGTASQAFNTATVTEAAATAANSIATEAANTSSWGVSAEAKYGAEADWNENQASYEAQWSAGWEAEYKNAYSTAYSNVVSNSSVTRTNSETGADQTGTISAAFTTTEVGTGTQSLQKAIAQQETESKWGAEWDGSVEYQQEDGSYSVMTEAAWDAAYAASYESAYENASVQAAASAARYSNSDVTVTGIGVIADLNSLATSSFQADATKSAPTTTGNGNANAVAGGNLSTSSFATQANSTTASAFMQAFGSASAD